MVVTELPIVTLVRLVHFSNASVPIEVTESEIVISVYFDPDNAPSAIEVTPSGITADRAVVFLLYQITVLFKI